MAEWLIEDGIGETRAILVEDGAILEAAIEYPGDMLAGAIVPARLARILVPGRRGLAVAAGGAEILIEPLPPACSEGAAVRVEIMRAPIPEAGRPKDARGRITDAAIREGLTLAERIGPARRLVPGAGPDLFEAAGWSELLEEARTGAIAFPGGALRMSVTPAMTLFDVDGAAPPEQLAVTGAEAAARAIRRMGISGSIGIDLPTLDRAARAAPAAAIDRLLPQPFERTAVNGFGFLQIVRRRTGPSLPERLAADPAGAAARALLRRAEWAGAPGGREIVAHPAVIARLAAETGWRSLLERRTGGPLALRDDPARAIWTGDVHLSSPGQS